MVLASIKLVLHCIVFLLKSNVYVTGLLAFTPFIQQFF